MPISESPSELSSDELSPEELSSAATAAAGRRAPSPVDALRARADALYRTAVECCRQHERWVRVATRSAYPPEQRAAVELRRVTEEALAEIVTAYEKCGARVAPGATDGAWWHAANVLWLASRELLRRQRVCERATRRLDGQSRDALGELHLDYELEGSALLGLRQAADAYRRVRPEAA